MDAEAGKPFEQREGPAATPVATKLPRRRHSRASGTKRELPGRPRRVIVRDAPELLIPSDLRPHDDDADDDDATDEK